MVSASRVGGELTHPPRCAVKGREAGRKPLPFTACQWSGRQWQIFYNLGQPEIIISGPRRQAAQGTLRSKVYWAYTLGWEGLI